MKYFFPDSEDTVDPTFDFATEERTSLKIRQQDDEYAHEVFADQGRVYDGLLVSMAIVAGRHWATKKGKAKQGKYTEAQVSRLFRDGVHSFFRLSDHPWGPLECMGDCGAFSYFELDEPPYTVDQVLDFYEGGRFDYGISVDHIIRDYNEKWDDASPLQPGPVPALVRARQQITLDLAAEFMRKHRKRRLKFTPLGVAQGWSPWSFARSFDQLQRMGFDYIALGGMVSLSDDQVLGCLRAIATVRRPETRIHVLGMGKIAMLAEFGRLGVASIDSTSPLRQAWLDPKNNYHTIEAAFTAIRIPQTDYWKTERAIPPERRAHAEALEHTCLETLTRFDAGKASVDDVLAALEAYNEVHGIVSDRVDPDAARRVLEAKPWKKCPCAICRDIGVNVIVLRGAERNRRRGFHNVAVFSQRLRMLTAQAAF